jgi:hypothetical protein
VGKRNLDGFHWYQCTKQVHAVKIHAIEVVGDDCEITIIPEGDAPEFQVTPEWYKKHQPRAGGYFVVYEDGYESFSPAKAFEEGYFEI